MLMMSCCSLGASQRPERCENHALLLIAIFALIVPSAWFRSDDADEQCLEPALNKANALSDLERKNRECITADITCIRRVQVARVGGVVVAVMPEARVLDARTTFEVGRSRMDVSVILCAG